MSMPVFFICFLISSNQGDYLAYFMFSKMHYLSDLIRLVKLAKIELENVVNHS